MLISSHFINLLGRDEAFLKKLKTLSEKGEFLFKAQNFGAYNAVVSIFKEYYSSKNPSRDFAKVCER